MIPVVKEKNQKILMSLEKIFSSLILAEVFNFFMFEYKNLNSSLSDLYGYNAVSILLFKKIVKTYDIIEFMVL